MAFNLDTSTDFGKRTAKRIEREGILWLTTVSAKGVPPPNPVWFLWNDGEFLVFSEPDQAKLANIKRNGGVSLNLNSTVHGADVVVFTGSAELSDKATLSADMISRYVAKYADGIASVGMTGESFFAQYSDGIRFIPAKVRGF
jgi:PPOX class probable F420-dependent enzyme